MYKLNSILLFSDNPKRLLEFYKKVLQSEPDWSNGDYADFETGGAYLEIGPHDKVHGLSSNPERILLNFHVKDARAEYQRLKGLGITVIQEPYNPKEDPRLTIATFADPDGNYFQLMTAWEEMEK